MSFTLRKTHRLPGRVSKLKVVAFAASRVRSPKRAVSTVPGWYQFFEVKSDSS